MVVSVIPAHHILLIHAIIMMFIGMIVVEVRKKRKQSVEQADILVIAIVLMVIFTEII